MEVQWMFEKEVLGFNFDGVNKTIWLATEKRDALLLTLSKWIKGANKGQGKDGLGAIPFKEFQSVTSTIWHGFISIPQGNGLFSPVNKILAIKPDLVFLHRNKQLFRTIRDMKMLLRESTIKPTKCKELVSGRQDYIGVKDASGYGVSGVIFGKNMPCTPTVFSHAVARMGNTADKLKLQPYQEIDELGPGNGWAPLAVAGDGGGMRH